MKRITEERLAEIKDSVARRKCLFGGQFGLAESELLDEIEALRSENEQLVRQLNVAYAAETKALSDALKRIAQLEEALRSAPESEDAANRCHGYSCCGGGPSEAYDNWDAIRDAALKGGAP